MGKKIGGLEEDIVLMGGMVAGMYLLIRNLLPNLLPNLGVSDADRQILDAQQTATPGSNIFAADSNLASAWAVQNYNWADFDNSNDYLMSAFNNYKHGNMPTTEPIYKTMQLYYDLYNALVGHLYSGDQSAINTALNSITNKWQPGVIAELFADINGINFWQTLRYGSFPMRYGLDGTDLASHVKRINNLPD